MLQRPRSDSSGSADFNDFVSTTTRNGRISAEGIGMWTDDEHERFLAAMKIFPTGPWRLVAEYIGSRNARQTMTHAQKYKQKIARRQRGLRTPGRTPSHRPRQASISESESGSDVSEEAAAVRPYLPVVIRTRMTGEPRAAPALASDDVVYDNFLSLDQEWSDLDEDIELLLSSTDALYTPLDFATPQSPKSPADQAEDDTMWVEDYINMMIQPFDT